MTDRDRLRRYFENSFEQECFTVKWHGDQITVTDSQDESLTFCIQADRIYNVTEHKYEIEL